MYHVVVATTNPAKIKAVILAFKDTFGTECFRIEGINVESGVPQQPIGNIETQTGARQRVIAARQIHPTADFWIGIEAGIEDNMTFSWIVIEHLQHRGESRSASLMLPEIILQGIHQGRELGDEMAKFSGITDLRYQEGAIGFFTAGKLTRTRVYHQALLLALVPFQHEVYQN